MGSSEAVGDEATAKGEPLLIASPGQYARVGPAWSVA